MKRARSYDTPREPGSASGARAPLVGERTAMEVWIRRLALQEALSDLYTHAHLEEDVAAYNADMAAGRVYDRDTPAAQRILATAAGNRQIPRDDHATRDVALRRIRMKEAVWRIYSALYDVDVSPVAFLDVVQQYMELFPELRSATPVFTLDAAHTYQDDLWNVDHVATLTDLVAYGWFLVEDDPAIVPRVVPKIRILNGFVPSPDLQSIIDWFDTPVPPMVADYVDLTSESTGSDDEYEDAFGGRRRWHGYARSASISDLLRGRRSVRTFSAGRPW